MTAPLDEKALLAAIDVACRNAGHDPNACMFGSGGTGVGSECHVTYREAHRAGTSQVIRAYLSAVALPDELEVVAWRSRVTGGDDWSFTPFDPTCDTTDFHAVEMLVRADQAHSTIAALRAEVERLRADCRTRADATIRMMKRAETAEAEVQRLAEEKEALRKVVSECAASLMNGAAISPEATLDFMKLLPTEIQMVVLAYKTRIKALEEALNEIRELNMSGADENGHRWANSDLIEQTIVFALTGARKAMEGGE